MQTASCAASPCTPLLRLRRPPPRPSAAPTLAFRVPAAAPIHGLSLSSRLSFRISDLERLTSSDPKRAEGFAVRATSVPESADTPAEPNALLETLQLGLLFGLWYLFNIYFNIYNKQVLKVFHYPITITTFQFAIGSVFALFMWATNLYKRPKISAAQVVAILPLAVVHTMGNLFTNMSLGKVAVSFTHTIKAMEPFFSVLLSALFLGEVSSSRFAKRKLDESVFLGNRLQVSYAPHFESRSDTMEKLEGRRKEVLGRIKSGRLEGSKTRGEASSLSNVKHRDYIKTGQASHHADAFFSHVSSNKDYFSSPSMNETVQLVRGKLDKIQSSSQQTETGPASKKMRVDNRRRI